MLSGTNSEGIFWTHIAESYPVKLCNALVKMLFHGVLASSAVNLDKLFCKMC